MAERVKDNLELITEQGEKLFKKEKKISLVYVRSAGVKLSSPAGTGSPEDCELEAGGAGKDQCKFLLSQFSLTV